MTSISAWSLSSSKVSRSVTEVRLVMPRPSRCDDRRVIHYRHPGFLVHAEPLLAVDRGRLAALDLLLFALAFGELRLQRRDLLVGDLLREGLLAAGPLALLAVRVARAGLRLVQLLEGLPPQGVAFFGLEAVFAPRGVGQEREQDDGRRAAAGEVLSNHLRPGRVLDGPKPVMRIRAA